MGIHHKGHKGAHRRRKGWARQRGPQGRTAKCPVPCAPLRLRGEGPQRLQGARRKGPAGPPERPAKRNVNNYTEPDSQSQVLFLGKFGGTAGLGTAERPAGPNGEVPGPLRTFASSRRRAAFGKFGGLEVWLAASFVAPQGRSVLCSPFSVLQDAAGVLPVSRTPPAPRRGGRRPGRPWPRRPGRCAPPRACAGRDRSPADRPARCGG